MRPLGCMLAVALLVLASGCATRYQPVGATGGFSDQQIDENTFRVVFNGNGYTSKSTVENYLMFRCAELTHVKGYDYFVIIGSDTTSRQSSYTTQGTYRSTTTGSATSYGRTAYGTATTTGTYTPGQTIKFTKFGGMALIKVFRGEKPLHNPNAYDAVAVINFLGPSVEQ